MSKEFKAREVGGCIACAAPVFDKSQMGLELVDKSAVRAMFLLADYSMIEVTFCVECASQLDQDCLNHDFLSGLWQALLNGWKKEASDAAKGWLSRTARENFILEYKCYRRWIDILNPVNKGA